jgi:hypothetical protein
MRSKRKRVGKVTAAESKLKVLTPAQTRDLCKRVMSLCSVYIADTFEQDISDTDET